MNGHPGTAAQERCEIPRATAAARKYGEELQKAIGELSERLVGVMRTDPPAAPCIEKQSESATPFGLELSEIVNLILSARQSIASIIQRLEL